MVDVTRHCTTPAGDQLDLVLVGQGSRQRMGVARHPGPRQVVDEDRDPGAARKEGRCVHYGLTVPKRLSHSAMTFLRSSERGPQFHEAGGVRLAYRYRKGNGPTVVFLPGYMSDMTGSKAEALDAWAAATGQAYLRLDYSGCGASGGRFDDGSIGRWTADALAVIAAVTKAPPILVGSSMGGWIALRVALARPVAALVGIAAAPDFTEWGLALTDADRASLATRGFVERPSDYGDTPYRYTVALIRDAPTQLVMHDAIALDCPVRLLHGQADPDVPWRLSLDLAGQLRSADVQVTLVKDGDHRLSRPQDLALLVATLDALLEELP